MSNGSSPILFIYIISIPAIFEETLIHFEMIILIREELHTISANEK